MRKNILLILSFIIQSNFVCSDLTPVTHMFPKLNHLFQYFEPTSLLLSYLQYRKTNGLIYYNTLPHIRTQYIPVSSSHGFTSNIMFDFAITAFSTRIKEIIGNMKQQSHPT